MSWVGLGRAEAPASSENKVLVIFVDSLRPDVVDAMVAQERLPNIKKLFYDKGLRFENFFTSFPSLTANAVACLVTGKWPDETGMKAQSIFERFPARKKNWLRRVFTSSGNFPRSTNLLTHADKATAVLSRNKVKALYDYLDEKYHTALMPVTPSVVPWAWPRLAANEVDRPYHVGVEAPQILDDLNGKYALRYMVPDHRGRLFIVWFPQMDEEQHLYERGQMSEAAWKRMEKVDEWLGKLYGGFLKEGKGKEPYVILFSDHGAYGGEGGVYNQPYYLGRDFFYELLKINIRGPDHSSHHPGTDLESYAYIDNMGRGQARIFLPVGDMTSCSWTRPNTLRELQRYGLGPNRRPVDLVTEILNINLEDRNKFPGKVSPYPVDLLFVKLAENLVAVYRRGGVQALIRIEDRGGKLYFQYTPVTDLSQDEAGRLSYKETLAVDPFGYLKDPKFLAGGDAAGFLQGFHDDAAWLEVTYGTGYPDAVPATAHALFWKAGLAAMAKSQDPDLWLSAAPGWNFRYEEINGADHGAILRDAMHATLMISGPRIRAGVESKPHRVLELTPTLLELIGYKGKTDLDFAPMEGIYDRS